MTLKTPSKHFIMVSHEQYNRIIKLMHTLDYEEAIDKIVAKGTHTQTNPLIDTQTANAILWHGNIVIEKPL